MVSQIFIRWIVIYPVDSAIQRLNNRSQFVTLTHAQHECSQHSFGFPSRPFQFFARVSNPVAFLFKTLMKTLLYMPPDPPRRASLFPGVKPSCRPVQTVVKSLLSMPPDPPRRASLCPGVKAVFPLVQNLNETPVPLRMYGMHRTQCDHVRSDLLPREAYVKHGFGEGAFT